MKKVLVMMFSLAIALGVEAQPKISGAFRGGSLSGGVRGGTYGKPQVTVIAPAVPIYPYYGYGLGFRPRFGYGYSPFYDPFYYDRYNSRPTELDLQIEDIKDEYSYKISTVKKDKSLPKDERKQKVRELKHEREQAIIDAKKSYYSRKNSRNDS